MNRFESRDAGARAVALINGIEFPFRHCPPGTFAMGSPETEPGRSDDETPRWTTLTNGFWLLETQTTQRTWRALIGTNPSELVGDDFPVSNVSERDCEEYLALLNASGELPRGWRADLPTEAQWEYACRAGTTSAFYTGETLTPKDGNIGGAIGSPIRVGAYPPNPWGLFDMCGNVWERTKDRYAERSREDAIDPLETEGELQVLRGGSWRSAPERNRSAFRHKDPPEHRHGYVGFRIALVRR